MNSIEDNSLFEFTRKNINKVSQVRDLELLIDSLKDSRVVMLGESTHGTEEFYQWRRVISQWLIAKHNFKFIAIEGDWPDAQRINRYIHAHESTVQTTIVPSHEGGTVPVCARDVLNGFSRWPTWMWANTETMRFMEWLKSHNLRHLDTGVSFHGLDVYSLFQSIDAVIAQLERVSPFLARRAKKQYACFDQYRRNEYSFAKSILRLPDGCEKEVLAVLKDILALQTQESMGDELFDAVQGAKVIKNAELYYRSMMFSDESWNVRDRHMLDSLESLLTQYGDESKGIVWAHNTHIGDYRATDMASQGLVNLGGLARERFGKESVSLVGFSTYQGHVTASRAWDGPIQELEVPPARKGSYEEMFHRVCTSSFSNTVYVMMETSFVKSPLAELHGQRAIGVVYDPARERWSQYVPTSLAKRYDAFFFIDHTTALSPLVLATEENEIPATWPTGR